MASSENHTLQIKKIASGLNFNYCGISKARFLEEEADHLESWLHSGMHGSMAYMENHFEKRLDPTLLVPGAKSVVSLLYNYFPKTEMAGGGRYKIAKYTYGKDYHHVIKKKLKEFIQHIQDEIGEVHGRVFVDSAPVMERQWARNSGLGWLGKNSLLLNKQMGSFFFLAQLILDLELEPDVLESDHCGTCTRCIDACPTNAIVGDGVVDASKCISYFTIELKESISEEVKGKFNNWIFGCDICQDVCPWNNFAFAHNEPMFEPAEDVKAMSATDWEELTEEVFNKRFQDSAISRTGFDGIKRNIGFLKDGSSDS